MSFFWKFSIFIIWLKFKKSHYIFYMVQVGSQKYKMMFKKIYFQFFLAKFG
jgi:hypothetical protein